MAIPNALSARSSAWGRPNIRWRDVLRGITAPIAALILAVSPIVMSAQVHAATHLARSARNPAFVEIDMSPVRDWLNPNAEPREDLIIDAADRITNLASQHPNRMITIRFKENRIDFDNLSTEDKRVLESWATSANDAREVYERRTAMILERIIKRVRRHPSPVMLSVMNLPATSKTTGAHAAVTNQRFRSVINDLQGFVYSRPFMMSHPENNKSLIRRHLAEGYRAADGRPVILKANGQWYTSVTLDGSLRGPESSTALSSGQAPPDALQPLSPETPSPLAQLIAVWGQANSTWDLNDDGTVDVSDLMMLINNWPQYSGGGGSGGGSGGPGTPGIAGQYTNLAEQYVRGSGVDLNLDLSGAPEGGHVVFQVWSDVSESVEAAHTDWEAPWEYPAESLDQVTLGNGEVQALVRSATSQNLAIIRHNTTFVASQPAGSPTDGDESGGPAMPVGDPGDPQDPEEPAEPTLPPPPPPPPPQPPSGGGSSGDPNAQSPSPVIKVISSTGMAPFTVHVHALDSAWGVGDELGSRFEWTFGDAEGEFDTLGGWNAAHTYEQPGTYTVTLKVTNQAGNAAAVTKTITVTPDNRTAIHVADTGSDSNPGTYAQPVKTVARAFQMLGDNKKILLRRAGTYSISNSVSVNADNVVIGAYGNGSRPTLWWTTNSQYPNMINIGSESTNVTVQDLVFDSPFTPNNLIVRGLGCAGTNVTVRRCHFGKVSYAMNGAGDVRGWLTMGNTTGQLGAYYIWAEGEDHVHVGNTVANSTDEHIIRLGWGQRVNISHNDFTNTAKSTIWCMLGDHCYISDNKLTSGRVLFGPNHANSSPGERYDWVVFERNELQGAGIILYSGADWITMRNNVIRNDGGECFAIWGWHAEYNRNNHDVTIVNNTCFNNSNQYGRFLKLGDGATNVIVANNLYCAPSLNTNWGAGNVICDDADLATHVFRHNLWATPDNGSNVHSLAVGGQTVTQWDALPQTINELYRPFGGTSLNSAYQPQFNANVSWALNSVWDDFNGDPRPRVGTVTAGAVQMP